MLLISACLAGVNCKYNGGNNYNEEILKLVKDGKAILVCPEQLGGLQTPRMPSEIRYIDKKRHVISSDGHDVTKEYERGSKETLQLAKNLNVKQAILKSKSPSCGCGKIYDGTFSNKLIDGNGITTDLLLKNGIMVMTENEYIQSLSQKND